jgi:hypothetical protein
MQYSQVKKGVQQYDHAASCVIAQQYSPATFVALRFYTPKDTSYALVKMLFQNF